MGATEDSMAVKDWMRERVRQLGGELSVNRAEPGTLLEAKIPLFNALFRAL